MEKEQAVQNIIKVFDNVMTTDDAVMKQCNMLRIVLLNLEIEGARIGHNNAIKPIAERLEKSLMEIEESIRLLVENNRSIYKDSINVLKEGA